MFICENGHESYEGGFCEECGSAMTEIGSEAAVMYPDPLRVAASPAKHEFIPSALENVPVVTPPLFSSSQSTKSVVTSPNTVPSYAQLQELSDKVSQQLRNEDTLKKLCETIIADNEVTREEWLQLQELRPTVTEQTWQKYMGKYKIAEPTTFSNPDQIGTLHWRVDGQLQAKCRCILEFRVTSLDDKLALLNLTFSGPQNEFEWETTFSNDIHDLKETTWTPQTHGLSLLTISGYTETHSEVLRIGIQRSIRLNVSPLTHGDSYTTIINNEGHIVSGEIGVKTFGTLPVAGYLANKGQQGLPLQQNQWSSVPIVIKKREPKQISVNVPQSEPEPSPSVVEIAEPNTTEIAQIEGSNTEADSTVDVIPAKGLSPRPYTISCPNGSEVTLFFGERLIIGRVHDSPTVDPMEQLGVFCYRPNGDTDVNSSRAISRQSVEVVHVDNDYCLRQIGQSLVHIDGIKLTVDKETYLTSGQHSTIMMGEHSPVHEGFIPITLDCVVIDGRQLQLDIGDAFRAYDGTFLILNKQPGAMAFAQKVGKETIRNVWITGAVTLAELTGIKKLAYNDIIVFRHASRVWLTNVNQPHSNVLEFSHQSLALLMNGFRVTQE
jgi:hypothetical protein